MARSPLIIVGPRRPLLGWSALACAFFACLCKGTTGADVCGCGIGSSWQSQAFECRLLDVAVSSEEEKCCVQGGKPYCVCEETGQPSPIYAGGCMLYTTALGAANHHSRQECLQFKHENAQATHGVFIKKLSPDDWETNPQRYVKGCRPCIKYNGDHDPCHFGLEATRAPPTCKWPTHCGFLLPSARSAHGLHDPVRAIVCLQLPNSPRTTTMGLYPC